MSDARVPFDAITLAFGVPVTITRPAPDNAPIATTGVWLEPNTEDQPFGTDVRRAEPRRLLAIPRSALAMVPVRGTTVAAPEIEGGTVKTWRVDGVERSDADHWRLFVIVQ